MLAMAEVAQSRRGLQTDFSFVFLTTCGRQGLAFSTLGLHSATLFLCVKRI